MSQGLILEWCLYFEHIKSNPIVTHILLGSIPYDKPSHEIQKSHNKNDLSRPMNICLIFGINAGRGLSKYKIGSLQPVQDKMMLQFVQYTC